MRYLDPGSHQKRPTAAKNITKIPKMIKIVFFSIVFVLNLVNCAPEGFVTTPVGYVSQDCYHQIGNGAEINELDDGTVYISEKDGSTYEIPKCHSKRMEIPKPEKIEDPAFPDSYDGWLAYTSYQIQSPLKTFDTFLGYFSVPNNPVNVPERLYIFTGLQNNDWVPVIDPEPPVFDIIQPVLQYPADSGAGQWSVKSWYVTLTGGVVVSPEIIVQVGDNIFGNMTRVSGNKWYIAGVSGKTGKTSEVTVNRARLALQPWAYNTLECYGCADCSYQPTQPCSFTKLSLTSGSSSVTPVWKAYTSPTPKCSTNKAVIKDPATVIIDFQ